MKLVYVKTFVIPEISCSVSEKISRLLNPIVKAKGYLVDRYEAETVTSLQVGDGL